MSRNSLIPATAKRIISMALGTGDGLKGLRDRALLLIGFAGASRRIAQPTTGDLCHEAPTHAVTRTSRSSATGSIGNSPGGFFLH